MTSARNERPRRRLPFDLGDLGVLPPTFLRALFFSYLTLVLLLFTFFVPPFQKSDEQAHFHRAVSLTNLDLVCDRDADGVSYFAMKRKYSDLPDILHFWDVATEYKAKFRVEWLRADFSGPQFNETGRIYDFCGLSPVGYPPNALGILAGKPFQNPLVSFYGGRIAGALFFVLVLLAALRITPERYKPIVYCYAALPMVLHQVSANSSDAMQLPLFLLIFACLVRFIADRGPIKPLHLAVFLALLWWTVNIRLFAFYPMLLLLFVIDHEQIAPRFSRYVLIVSVFLVVTVTTTGLLAAVYLPHWTVDPPGYAATDAEAQISFVLDHPLHFLKASYQTLHVWGARLIWETIGFFGWLDYGFNYLPYYLATLLAGFGFYALMDRDVLLTRPSQLLIILLAVFLTVVLLFASLYAVWSPVGADMVTGLQGRYFVGMLPITVFALSQLAVSIGRQRFVQILLGVVSLFLLFNILRAIYLRYYV